VRPILGIYPEHFKIFFPYAFQRSEEFLHSRFDFVHYTSATNAFRIIEGKQVTLRNALLMNDFSEITHGEQCFAEAWMSEDGIGQEGNDGRFKKVLDRLHYDLAASVGQVFFDFEHSRKRNTFLLSISEHDPRKEDNLGRLSMWRAYGGKTNVALVLNPESILQDTDANLGFTSPVAYCKVGDFQEHLSTLCDSLENNFDVLETIGHERVGQYLRTAISTALVCTKHPGFSEEREWRLVYAPWLAPSALVKEEIVNIDGVPQLVNLVKLADRPEYNLKNMSPQSIIKRIIIGPTEYPSILYDAFCSKLEANGFQSVDSFVVVSDIPIRR
jgi:hypothetical protein